MNIRSLSNPAQILAQDKIEGQKRDLKSSQASDRDANGQQTFGDGGEERAMSQEELQEVLWRIQNHEGIQANGLLVELIFENNKPWLAVKDPQGNLIKKINQKQMSLYLDQGNAEDFSLVRKTA